MRAFALLFAAALAFASGAQAQAPAKITVVAAQNFYGDIARQIGGDRVTVVEVLTNPDQDPHLYEPSPAVARQIADAKIVITNGAHFDEWADKLMKAAPRPGRTVITAAKLVKAKHGDNPHIWYAPTTMPAVAKAIAAAFTQADSANAAAYAEGLTRTLAGLDRIAQRVADMRARHTGKSIAATEPVIGPLADALGLTMRNQSFQRAILNETEPSARDIAAFETDLKTKKAAVLIYNKQVSEKLAERLIAIARASQVPVVAVTETQPADASYQDWMLGQLDALDKALTGSGT